MAASSSASKAFHQSVVFIISDVTGAARMRRIPLGKGMVVGHVLYKVTMVSYWPVLYS